MPDTLWNSHSRDRAQSRASGQRNRTAKIQHAGATAHLSGQLPGHGSSPGRLSRRVSLLPVRGMVCATCVRRVEERLRAIPGVVRVVVDLSSRGPSPALVEYERSSRDEIDDAISAAGFDVAG